MKYNATFWSKNKETGRIDPLNILSVEAKDEDSALVIALAEADKLNHPQHVLIEISGNIIEL